MAAESGQDILSMSDDDFMNLAVPPADVEASASTEVDQQVDEEQNQETQVKTDEETEQNTDRQEGEKDPKEDEQEEEDETDPAKQPTQQSTKESVDEPKPKTDPVGSKAEPKVKTDTQTKADTPVKTDGGEPDYKALYEGLMAPIKANGKTIEIRNPEELVKLAQQGANYTRKMQELAPHRKMLLMLENNGLLDEGQLSYLIDLSKKDPEAIKKLVKDSGINPLDIDTETEQTYRPGNHRVTDDEAAFRTTLDDISSFDEGRQTLQVINSTWDQASKELLFKDPASLTLIHEHREAGFYDRITKELEHQKTLGNVPANVPFIEAYRKVGDWMAEQGAFEDLIAKQKPVASAPVKTPVATTVAAKKSPVANNEKASAAAQSKTTSKTAKPLINPLAMSDEEFLKQFENRL